MKLQCCVISLIIRISLHLRGMFPGNVWVSHLFACIIRFSMNLYAMVISSLTVLWHIFLSLKSQLFRKVIAVSSSLWTSPKSTVSKSLSVHSPVFVGRRLDSLATAIQVARISVERSRKINHARLLAHAKATSHKRCYACSEYGHFKRNCHARNDWRSSEKRPCFLSRQTRIRCFQFFRVSRT